MALDPEQEFFELCCGSGAVSLELISRGHNPAKITMVDAGPWGDVWRLVGAGEFDLRTLEIVCGEADVAPDKVPDALSALARDIPPSHPLAPYAFLMLQAGSFGGKPIGCKAHGWRTHGWYPVDHPRCWSPPPGAVLYRLRKIVSRCIGATGIRARVEALQPPRGAVAYLDPPYVGTSGYSEAGSVETMLERWSANAVYVSELRPLAGRYRKLRSRSTAGITGAAAAVDASEYLSLFNADWPGPDLLKIEQFQLFGDEPSAAESVTLPT